MHHHENGKHDVDLYTAAVASSSAPLYFDPTLHHNKYLELESLLDGGIICNNPAFYAYNIAKHFK